MKKAIWLGTLIMLLALPLPALAGQLQATLYKNPHCSCCEAYADYLRENGFEVDVKETKDLEGITLKAGVPERLVTLCSSGAMLWSVMSPQTS
jgi:hypothetical protein